MKSILNEKFKIQKFKDKLVATYPNLIKHNVQNAFWGVGKNGDGEDRLGKILTSKREELMKQNGNNG